MDKTALMPNKQILLWLMAGLAMATLPLFKYQPSWIMFACFSMLGWRVLSELGVVPVPKQHKYFKFFHFTIALGLIVSLALTYGVAMNKAAGIGLLLLMTSMKVVEIETQRDFYLGVFLGFLLIIINFSYNQSLPSLLMNLLVTVIFTVCLLSANLPSNGVSKRWRIKFAAKMLGLSLPFVLVLFLLFPRFQGPLWEIPENKYTANFGVHKELSQGSEDGTGQTSEKQTAVTGVSNELKVGDISQLVQSDEIAFRVKFDGETPATPALYWRGAVLSRTDGKKWTAIKTDFDKPDIEPAGRRYKYTMIIEPHNQKWLFALDLPVSLPDDLTAWLNDKATLVNKEPVTERLQYKLSSSDRYRYNAELYPPSINLALPRGVHPKTRTLAKQWRQQVNTDEEFVDWVLQYFNEESFSYTLSPESLPGDTVDQFLTKTKQGFCGHYATSFAVIMRAVGIPARVVTGYAGGELNPIDNTFTVRQREAHAWNEVWLPKRGWVRVDPTKAIPAERIEQSVNELLENQATESNRQESVFNQFWRGVKNNWRALNNAWDLWVPSYGQALQQKFLSMLGMKDPSWKQMTVWLLSLILLIFTAVYFFVFRHSKIELEKRLYDKFCRKLKKKGIVRRANEGPRDFASRAIKTLPACNEQIDKITDLYIELRYQAHGGSIQDLSDQVTSFKP